MKQFRFVLWAAIALLGGYLAWAILSNTAKEAGLMEVAGRADIGGPFKAQLTNGSEITQQDMLGRPHAVFFGFTHCPDVCPITLAEASGWLQALGDDGDKIDVYFVTVDPERDSPELLGQYLTAFDKRIKGISGTPEQIQELVKAWRVYVKKGVDEGDGYNVDHTATTYLMNAKGEFVRTIAYGEDKEVAVRKIRLLLDQK